MTREMRRKDRAATPEQTQEILAKGDYGVLCTTSAEGQPYGTPLHYCLLEGSLYFHCGLSGQKLDNLAANDRVSFVVVNRCEVMPDEFATLYESAVVFGQCLEVEGAEKQTALEGLLDKYSPEFRAEGLEYTAKVYDKARVYKIAMESVSGKARNAR
ncbi:MAG: pyridoxamine 5'-phosphate oxidase family protein [Desulfarculaceae bacterium]|nr:pyridoxamine 5'-phosphate oxidase family protein [Desulfarculaceae bacterium]